MNQTTIQRIFKQVPAVDMHTHLFPAGFGKYALSGIDALLTYHYLEAEYFRLKELSPEQYFALAQSTRADTIWDALFVRNTPISDATIGLVAIFEALGLDVHERTLAGARAYFQSQNPDDHLSHVLRLANLDYIVMTNDPIDDREASVWLKGDPFDPRFRAALRLDRIVAEADTRWRTAGDLQRFLEDWTARMNPLYMAISLSSLRPLMEETESARRVRTVLLPLCHDRCIPLALMLGVRRGVNPRIGIAADASCLVDLTPLGDLCQMYPDNQILATCLSLGNQHELCVLARKFANLTPFGCWWFVNTPSIVHRITEQRIEMLGPTFIAQHSDARVLEQLIYKWQNARRIVGSAYAKSAARLAATGYQLSPEAVTRDADLLLRGNFISLCGRSFQLPATKPRNPELCGRNQQ